MEKAISYLNKNFSDYKQALIDYSKKYYPNMAIDFDDASVASWLLDINAAIGDNLAYHIDKTFQETNLDSANEKSSVYAMARSNGYKIPGPKGAMAEVQFSCYLPIADGNGANGNRTPEWKYAPIIRRGTKVTGGGQSFELTYDVDFAEQFDSDGNSNRTIVPVEDSNGNIVKYKVTKLAVVVAGETKVFRQALRSKDIKPFMQVTLPVENIMNVESVITKDGTNVKENPTYGEFYMLNESSTGFVGNKRFFEVESLAQQNRWGEVDNGEGKASVKEYGYNSNGVVIPAYSVTKGEWKRVNRKFITEYSDNGYLTLTFGTGLNANTDIEVNTESNFARYQISKMIRNDSLGYLPDADTTLFVLYRVGGGTASNLAKGAISTISSLKSDIGTRMTNPNASIISEVKNSIKVVSTSPSVSGKDMPTTQELKYLMKYNHNAQERCVTVKDYIARTMLMPSKYGTPFRVGATEDNNKIMLYLLGVDSNGNLDSSLPLELVQNIQNYLSEYRSINDFVEIKSGRIINLSFEVKALINSDYNEADVRAAIREVITDYMDINKHNMGDDIFVGDIEKEISKIDGVENLIYLHVYNEYGVNYSSSLSTQETMVENACTVDESVEEAGVRAMLDLDASDKVIYSDGDSMLEIKYPSTDIRIITKTR